MGAAFGGTGQDSGHESTAGESHTQHMKNSNPKSKR